MYIVRFWVHHDNLGMTVKTLMGPLESCLVMDSLVSWGLDSGMYFVEHPGSKRCILEHKKPDFPELQYCTRQCFSQYFLIPFLFAVSSDKDTTGQCILPLIQQ